MDIRSAGPLDGIRVLDFTRVLAGPYATRILGDLGAEVIKVQSKRTAQGTESDASAYFRAWNRNKKSVTLDLDCPEAREAILGLVNVSDVVVENFSPRVMSNWGLTYDRMREARADIILLSMSAMGQTGPWRDYVGYGQTMQALSGITRMTSWDERSPEGLGQAYADVVAGLYGVVAILAALEYRDRCGAGQHIDLSNHEAMCSLMGPILLELSTGRRRPSSPWERGGRRCGRSLRVLPVSRRRQVVRYRGVRRSAMADAAPHPGRSPLGTGTGNIPRPRCGSGTRKNWTGTFANGPPAGLRKTSFGACRKRGFPRASCRTPATLRPTPS